MRARLGVVVLVGALAALTIGALAMAGQQRTLTAAEARRAMRAAEDATGGVAVRIDRNLQLGAMWEVEVIRPDGRHVDVLLDASFRVIDVGPERGATEPPSPADPYAEAPPRYEPPPSPKPQAGAQPRYAPRHPVSRYRVSDDDLRLSAYDVDRIAEAALAAAGGGTVTDVDQDFEGGATWEVEIRKPDGRRMDVLLDARFQVLNVSGEQDDGEYSDDDDDD
ncbi:MAG: PepSY domain-containing protein [Candidatus Eiseniibacteriota bacterium]